MTATLLLLLLAAPTSDESLPTEASGDEYLAVVSAPRQVAVEDPVAGYPQLTSHLAFEPRVDVMARNHPGVQGDIAIRGGIFEATGVNLGAVTLFDPQTGHYLTELPVPPAMLTAPEVLTGWDNAFSGFNATAGTLAYRWKPIESGGRIAADLADGWDNHQHLYLAHGWQTGETVIAADVDLARAAGDGTVRDADYAFARAAGRLQVRTPETQTDLFAGFQDKFYGWPYLYAVRQLHDLIGSSGAESDDVQTFLVAVNQVYDDGDTFVELSGAFRENTADYELDRNELGRFNDYQHQTWVWSAGADLRQRVGNAAVLGSLQVVQDRIESTALTFGPFRNRQYIKADLGAELAWEVDDDWSVESRIGVTYDDSDRNRSHGSPMLEVALESDTQRYYVQAARSTQVPGYTALASNPDAGLFRGDAGLGRERADNFEAGTHLRLGRLRLQLVAFHRRDYDLVDWTYSGASPTAARTASHLDIQTTGAEAMVRGRIAWLHWVAGYTFLHKEEDYGAADVDASFYALNYPTHRLTLALIIEPIPGLELRSDNELRDQAPNQLRRGRTRVALSMVRVQYKPDWLRGLVMHAAIDNLFNLGFQEVPGVPGSRRRIGGGLAYLF